MKEILIHLIRTGLEWSTERFIALLKAFYELWEVRIDSP